MPVKPDTPITRKEMYLDAATGGSSTLPEPVTIEEKYLAKIAGMTVDLPAPVPLKHKFLAKIAGMQVDVPTYTTGLPRIYAYLAKAAGQDIEVPQPITREEMYWFDYVGGQPTPSEHEYTGAVPVTFIANGQPLINFLISGNEEHSGTPTPDSPIIPEGCGDLEATGEHAGQYKIPISSANTTTPVYLGEVETTRRVKKLVLTGEEAIEIKTGNAKWYIPIADMRQPNMIDIKWYCSHYQAVANNVSWTSYDYMISWSSLDSGSGMGLRIRDIDFSTVATLADFKTYLQQQYAAGTPVTVWYVLATEETAVINEPLMRIGDYVDTLSMEQAGVQIPTVNGSNTLDVLTTVKPSEVYIKYNGEPVPQLSTLSSPSVDAPEEPSEEAEEAPEEEVQEETESITPETAEE